MPTRPVTEETSLRDELLRITLNCGSGLGGVLDQKNRVPELFVMMKGGPNRTGFLESNHGTFPEMVMVLFTSAPPWAAASVKAGALRSNLVALPQRGGTPLLFT